MHPTRSRALELSNPRFPTIVYFSKSQTQGITNHANISSKKQKSYTQSKIRPNKKQKDKTTKLKIFEVYF